jgi:hypothetical protein
MEVGKTHTIKICIRESLIKPVIKIWHDIESFAFVSADTVMPRYLTVALLRLLIGCTPVIDF